MPALSERVDVQIDAPILRYTFHSSTAAYSVFHAIASADPGERGRAFGTLAEGYWKPVYKYLRVRWRLAKEEAEDLTQEFFTRALEKQFFDRYDPQVARFRTYLRTCVDRFVANQRRAAICAKALAADPAARYPGAQELAAKVSQYLAGVAVAAYREGPAERVARFVRKYQVPILLLLAYLAMRTALIWWRGL